MAERAARRKPVAGGGGLQSPPSAGRGVAHESPLDWLNGRTGRHGRPFLAPEEFEAGERLRRDFTAAQMMPAVTANWSALQLPRAPRRRAGGDSRGTPSDGALAACQRVRAALAAVGPDLSGLLVDVCCLLTGLEDSERARLWPKRSAKIVLKIGLAQLAHHYGIAGADRTGRRRCRHAWGREGFRPVIGPVESVEEAV